MASTVALNSANIKPGITLIVLFYVLCICSSHFKVTQLGSQSYNPRSTILNMEQTVLRSLILRLIIITACLYVLFSSNQKNEFIKTSENKILYLKCICFLNDTYKIN